MAVLNNLYYYLRRVQRESGLLVSTSFPVSPNDEQQLTIDCINATLRELNNHHYLTFQQTEYLLTSVPGVASYDLTLPPYNLSDWRIARMAQNGVRRVIDDYPLLFLDYADRDFLQPTLTGHTLPTHYSAFGKQLLFYPIPDGTQMTIRYYSLFCSSTTDGVLGFRLVNETDTPLLEDQWEDGLVYGATVKVRAQQNTDEKFQFYLKRWEEWRASLLDMMQPGEDGFPQAIIPVRNQTWLDRKIGPLFNANI